MTDKILFSYISMFSFLVIIIFFYSYFFYFFISLIIYLLFIQIGPSTELTSPQPPATTHRRDGDSCEREGGRLERGGRGCLQERVEG